jgi:hypothetical protein
MVSPVNSYNQLLNVGRIEYHPSVCAYGSSRAFAFQYVFLVMYEISEFLSWFSVRPILLPFSPSRHEFLEEVPNISQRPE